MLNMEILDMGGGERVVEHAGIRFNLDRITKAFGGMVLGDYDSENTLKRCRTYLESLDYQQLVNEHDRIRKFLRDNSGKPKVLDSILGFHFSDAVNPKINYTIRPFDYWIMVNKVIEEKSAKGRT